jgi:predicted metal-binding protein
VVVALEVAVGALAVAAGDTKVQKDQVVLVVAVVVAGYSPGQAVVEALELLLMAQVGEAVLLLAALVVVGEVMVAVAGEQTVVVVFHLVLAVKQLH